MKINTIKTLKAEREYWTNKLSEVESTESKEYINEQLEILNYKIESKIMDKQWLIDMVTCVAGVTIGSIIYDKWKK